MKLIHTNSLFNHIANTNGISLNQGKVLKYEPKVNNENLTTKFFSNTQNLSQFSSNAAIVQNSKRKNLRDRKSDIDLTGIKSGYEDFKS